MSARRLGALAIAGVVFAAASTLAAGSALPQRRSAPTEVAMPTVKLSELPKEARETLALIRKGGPFPFARDGVVFGNREGRLPKRPRGYYHEYTVKTPGERTRGARRVVTGGARDEYYYTGDHYNSFRLIRN